MDFLCRDAACEDLTANPDAPWCNPEAW